MGKLESHRQKKIKRSIFFIGLISLLLIYFILSYGIKFLLSGSAYIGNLFNKDKTTTSISKNDDFYGTVQIDNILNATNSASITLSGHVSNFDTVSIFLNDRKIDEKEVEDNFDAQINNLIAGENKIYIIASSKNSKTTERTADYTVTYIKDKPRLEIASPTDESKTSKEEVLVVGKTDKEVVVEINGLPVVVNVLGDFQSSIKLQSGENIITVTAEDIAGNIESKEIKIICEKD